MLVFLFAHLLCERLLELLPEREFAALLQLVDVLDAGGEAEIV